MNFSKIFLLFAGFCEVSLHFLTVHNDLEAISSAILDVINTFYIKKEISFEFCIEFGATVRIEAIFNSLQKHNNANFASTLLYKKKPINFENWMYLTKSSIIFASGCLAYQTIHRDSILSNSYLQPLKFLIFIENCPLDLMKQNIASYVTRKRQTFQAGDIETFEYILINDGSSLHLSVIEWFTSEKCNEPQLRLLNTFNLVSRNWTEPLEDFENFNNFHGCPLGMWVINDKTIWNRIVYNNDSRSYEAEGLIPNVFYEMSKKYNFKPTSYPTRGVFGDHEVCFEIYRIESYSLQILQMTTPFLEIADWIFATPGELYTPYEKLLLPFDLWTWICLLICFISAFLVVLFVNRLPSFFKFRVYGEKVKTPGMNIVSIFFGHEQRREPIGGTARFMLINYVFFCLIFRTCYQNKLFEFMTSQPRKSPPKTIEDLRQQNYTMQFDIGVHAKPQTLNKIKNEQAGWSVCFKQLIPKSSLYQVIFIF